jgi:hypothetical protein
MVSYIYDVTTTQLFSPEKRKNIFKAPGLLRFVLKSFWLRIHFFFHLRAGKEFFNVFYSVTHLHFWTLIPQPNRIT